MAAESADKATIPLADFIHQLRDELDKARESAQGKDLQLEVGPIDLELAVQAQKEAHAGGGLRIYVFEAEAHGSMANVSTQQIRLTLKASVPADASTTPLGSLRLRALRFVDSLRAAVAKSRERRIPVDLESAPEAERAPAVRLADHGDW